MIWLFKNGEAKVFREDAVREKLAEGWRYERDKAVEAKKDPEKGKKESASGTVAKEKS